jgi:hypothetical protein
MTQLMLFFTLCCVKCSKRFDYFLKLPLLTSESLIPGASGKKKPDSIPSGAAVLSVRREIA